VALIGETFIIAVYILCVIVHLLYWVGIFYKLKPTGQIVKEASNPHSIVVCYKDEEDNLQNIIPTILSQSADEVIMVDDFSTDKSRQIVEHTNADTINSVTTDIDRPGKKAALYKGVSSASHKVVLLTDADCQPSSEFWSKHMNNGIIDADICLGYAPMYKGQGWLSIFSRYETYLTGIQSIGYAQAGMPYMGVGRNMAVAKDTALPILTDMQSDDLASGDDDLLVQQVIKNKGKVNTVVHPDAFVYSHSPESWRKYIRQKSRHMTTSVVYRFLHQLLLAVFAASHMLTFLLLLVILIFSQQYLTLALTILTLKWFVQLVVNYKLMGILKERDLWIKFPLLDIATFVFYTVMTPYLLIKNKKQWS